MALFHIYFDESGIHAKSSTIVVAGVIAECWQWELFETGWLKILQDYGVSSFHANKCEKAKAEYESWSGHVKHSFRRELIDYIGQNLNCGTYHVVDSMLYEKEVASCPKNRRLSAYEYCLLQCMAAVIFEKCVNPDIETVSVFIEQGQKVRPGLRNMLNSAVGKDNIVEEMVYADKADHSQFQVADFIAYEVFRRHDDLKSGTDIMRRQTLVELFDNFPVTGFHSKPDYLRQALALNPELWKDLES